MWVGRSVGPSTRWLSDDNSRTLGPRIMKLHRKIDHDMQITPIDFEVTRSKVKVTNKMRVSPEPQLKLIDPRRQINQGNLTHLRPAYLQTSLRMSSFLLHYLHHGPRVAIVDMVAPVLSAQMHLYFIGL
ncbi:hypothetical protein DPMN_141329 [Dreissena polymorpha]|uniref:Uncharacterized protein n=1 Tax=Dreissena polymorpha TaxID=45954 RepID=A0A9D4JHJ2_DREPO|nr:hypothetical protein DPMN_141329 [Dreissena polymorpha]